MKARYKKISAISSDKLWAASIIRLRLPDANPLTASTAEIAVLSTTAAARDFW